MYIIYIYTCLSPFPFVYDSDYMLILTLQRFADGKAGLGREVLAAAISLMVLGLLGIASVLE